MRGGMQEEHSEAPWAEFIVILRLQQPMAIPLLTKFLCVAEGRATPDTT